MTVVQNFKSRTQSRSGSPIKKRIAIRNGFWNVIGSQAPRGGGGGGTQIWFRRGCAAEAAKPIPIFKGHFGGKGYLLLRVFSQENDVFVYFSDEMGENYKSGGYV